MYRNDCANIYLNLRLWCDQGLWEREGDAGGFRSEDGVLLLVCRGRCHFHTQLLVDNVTSSCTKKLWQFQEKSVSHVHTYAIQQRAPLHTVRLVHNSNNTRTHCGIDLFR